MPHCPSNFAAVVDGQSKIKLKTVFKLRTLAASKCSSKSDDDTHNPMMDNATAQKYTVDTVDDVDITSATVHPE